MSLKALNPNQVKHALYLPRNSHPEKTPVFLVTFEKIRRPLRNMSYLVKGRSI
jgi:hypothetical protein